jgi:cyclic beta-1,2-glucan synthetase
MPAVANSMIYESLRYCFFCQKERVCGAKKSHGGCRKAPFYAFDPALNYQYKAFGVQRLALKAGANEDIVVVALFLVPRASHNPKDALLNLLRIREDYGYGRYGFYEAIEFSRGADHKNKKDAFLVKCFMAHHLGMSLLSVNNALNENICQKYFMEYDCNRPGEELLKEKVPFSAVILEGFDEKEPPVKPQRYVGEKGTRVFLGKDMYSLECKPFGGTIVSTRSAPKAA